MKHDIYVFDAFWTLIKPVSKLKNILRDEKISISKDLWTIIMTTPQSIIEVIENNLDITNRQKQILEQAISEEIEQWELYDDVLPTLDELYKQGKQIHLISNLGYEYAILVSKLLSKHIASDNIHLSFEKKLRKPDPKIYDIWIKHSQKVIMIWDSVKNDYIAPKSIGRDAIIIDRDNKIENQDRITDLSQLFDINL